MSRVFDALRQSELERNKTGAASAPAAAGLAEAPMEAPAPSGTIQSFGDDSEAPFADVATIVRHPDVARRLVAFDDPNSLAAEKFRMLATRLNHAQERQGLHKIVISSAAVDEGKSFVAMNLAATLVNMQKRVLLIDGDVRQPSIAKLLGQHDLSGISDWFFRNRPLAECVYKLADAPLWILPSGPVPDQPLLALQSPRMAELLAQTAGWADWVIIDSPPVLPVADLTLWSRLVDGVLLVVRQNQTRKALLERALETVDPNKLLGVVFNEADDRHLDMYKNYYGRIAPARNLPAGEK